MIDIAVWDESDIVQLAGIEKQCMEKPWNEKMLEEEYKNPFFVCLTAKKNGDVIGYINYHIISDEFHIANVAVIKSYRRKGIGSMLLESLLKRAAENNIRGVTLEVNENNTAAVGLYKKYGFITEGIRKNYYGNGKDALIMWKYLT
jgi:ribosomal-protein-alanine N-acetyltransferase